MIVNEQKYRYAKLLQTAKEQANNTVEIDDKEAILLGLESVDELHINIVSIEWTNIDDITIYSGTKPSLPNILINWDDNTVTEISSSYTNISTFNYNSAGTYNITASYKNFVTTNSINITVIKKELISIEWQTNNEITTYENTQAYLPNIKLNYNNNTSQYITINTSSVILNNPTYYSQIGDYEINATYKGFTTNNIIVHVVEKIEEDEILKNQELCFTNTRAQEIHIEFYNTDKEYSIDNKQTWIKCTGQHIYLQYNQSMYIRSINDESIADYVNLPFNITYSYSSISVSGNILSLRYKTIFNNFDLIKESISNKSNKNFEDIDVDSFRLYLGYYRCFKNCEWLRDASNLYLQTYSYDYFCEMFMGCTELENPPKLYSKVLKYNYCYMSMFEGCKNLKTAPELYATILTEKCYENMFKDCTHLITAPELPAMTLADLCYSSMFSNCTSLITVPELPATTLAYNCYQNMFNGCTRLINSLTILPATTLTTNCYNGMFANCYALINTPKLPATTLVWQCYQNMFNGCTSIVNAPELPATTLVSDCYSYMFLGCTSLNLITCLAINISVQYYCTYNWVEGVASTGLFIKNIEAQWDNAGIVPQNWTVIYYDTNEDKYYLDKNKEQECDDHGNLI